ncbi:hypothetical protein METESE_36960 [Mesoterricola sediminis]|uniref:Uncharacterized protein n=2 Tax=Mesoterricola sediminis TaxID=2927980 RepID=A0AA48HIC0_9BACT|nr:hypothetical protein METESE_36960 [Mesoterricola sediminis]
MTCRPFSLLMPGLVLAGCLAATSPAQAQVPQLLVELPLSAPDKAKDYAQATDISVTLTVHHQDQKGKDGLLSTRPLVAGLPGTFTKRDGQVFLNALSFIHEDFSKLKNRSGAYGGQVFSEEEFDSVRAELGKRAGTPGTVSLLAMVHYTYHGKPAVEFTINTPIGPFGEAKALFDRWFQEDMLIHSEAGAGTPVAKISFLGSELRKAHL